MKQAMLEPFDALELERTRLMAAQSALKPRLGDPSHWEESRPVFLAQYAALHRAAASGSAQPTFADGVLADLTERHMRAQPPGDGHTLAWLVWHMARCEDIPLQGVAVGGPQELDDGGWQEKIHTPIRHSGNAMTPAEIAAFSAAVNLKALLDYRDAVARRTRAWVETLAPADLKRKAPTARLEDLLVAGDVLPEAHTIAKYWVGQTVAGLLLMPASRHLVVHLGEALVLRKRLS